MRVKPSEQSGRVKNNTQYNNKVNVSSICYIAVLFVTFGHISVHRDCILGMLFMNMMYL